MDLIDNIRNIPSLVGKIFFLLLLANCTNPTSENTQKSVLPNTPEAVSRQWQIHLDKNEIDQAAALSTDLTKEWLMTNKALFLNDSQVYQTKFVQMNCITETNKATCHYTLSEAGELIEDYFLLKKIEGQWLSLIHI